MNSRTLSIFFVVFVGLLLAGGVFWFIGREKSNGRDKQEPKEKDEISVKELSLEERPYATLIPRADGHELHLTVTKLPKDASSMEYELVYTVASGITQGVPGTIKDLAGKTSIERDLLLGTCSSGKCRYDEGVEEGTFTLKFRDVKGKLAYKFETGFRLQQNPSKITSVDEEFSLSFSKGSLPKGYYLTMGTLGLPSASVPGKVAKGPYGVFSQNAAKISAEVSLGAKNYVYTANKWVGLEGSKTSLLGTFVSIE